VKDENIKEGFAGNLAKQFIQNKLTPVIAVVSVLLGLGAVWLTPKEEEPQISVPMVDITLANPGMEAREIERYITEPVERGMWGIDGVEYIYSATRPHGSLVTVRFKVGEPMEESILKIHHKLALLKGKGELPQTMMEPKVESFSIDDVPFLTLTFSSSSLNDYQLRNIMAPLARELSSTPDISKTEFLGGLKRSIRVVVDPKKLKDRGVSLLSVADALKKNHFYLPAGKDWRSDKTMDIEIGARLNSAEDVKNVVIGQRGGSVVRIQDIAQIIDGPEERTRVSYLMEKDKATKNAVSIVFSKRKGTNIVPLAKQLIQRAESFTKDLNQDIQFDVVRDYGSSAEAKSNELIEHLLIATFSVAVLIALFMGFKASLVVIIAVPVTLALTLAIYYFLGYTLNRVTLFALIFSIGILVDDAIVVVENIERHLRMNNFKNILPNTIKAVAEVGNPTILATFTVIGAVLPMAFVRGMMGPYMRPIPVGASLAMILSLFVAFMITPWAALKLFKNKENQHHGGHDEHGEEGALDKLYRKSMELMLASKKNSIAFGVFVMVLLGAATSMLYFKSVKVKMLPFDNKNEFQISLDYPVVTPLEVTAEKTKELTKKILENKNVKQVQIFVGEPAPYSFSGMVKHTFLRYNDYMADLQVVLTDKHDRSTPSHQVITDLRSVLDEFSAKYSVTSKILEIPPGPPVMATMVAEIYGPTEEARREAATKITNIFNKEPDFVDVDYSFRKMRDRKIYVYDYNAGGLLGSNAKNVAYLGRLLFSETSVVTLDDTSSPEPINVDLSIKNEVRSSDKPFANQVIPSFESGLADAANMISETKVKSTEVLMRKNLKPVVYVQSELTGAEEAPVYGIIKAEEQIPYKTQTADMPWDTSEITVKWDGEWFITYEVFRDLGGAFAVVMLLIYIMVLGWFKSFTLPFIILLPIPISLIGIFPAHWMAGTYFTATSMIGFIAGAGVIVRNSIILIDFIEHQMLEGQSVKDAVINAGVLRFRPMLLVAAAVVVGSSVMLWDPIFQGLAISLISGEVAATLLSRFAVPLLYYWGIGNSRKKQLEEMNA
jgi:multidrug efflux pump subunit AcrB